MKKNSPRPRSKRPTATIDLKAKEVKQDAQTNETVKTASTAKKDPQSSSDKTTSSSGKTTSSSVKSTSSSSGSRNAKSSASSSTRSSASPKSGDQKKPTASGSVKTPPPAKSSGGGGGFVSHLLSSVLGAVLGIFGLSYANNQNMLPAALQIGGGQAVSQQVSSLESKIVGLERATSASAPNGLGGRLANLNARLEKAEASLGGNKPGTSSLAQKVASLEATLGNLEQAAKTGKGGKLAGLTAVTKQLTTSNKRSLTLKTELIKVREEQAGFREDLTTIRSAQADFTTKTAKISNEIAKIQNSTAKMVADASRPPDVSAQINPVVAMLGDLTAKIDGVMNREAGSKAEGRDIALALSLGELKRAVNEGVPFEAELARVTPHAPKDLDFSALSQTASKGLVTSDKLRSRFSAISQKALASEHTVSSGSFVDQVMASAKSMVQVRPTGLVEGETTGAVLSRMEYKLQRNDLAGSLKESQALAGRAKDVMQPWLKQASSKLGGNTVLRALEDKIRNALAGGGSK